MGEVLAKWENKTRERIENPQKAEYMARVEDMWRTSIAYLMHIATTTEDHEVRENAWTAVSYHASIFGPASVEATGRVWDEFYHPVLPPKAEDSLQTPSYATGDRQFLE